MQLTPQQIQQLSQIIGVDITQFDPKEFAAGMDVEQEHQDVTNGHPVLTARIALAHLKEFPDYYSRLAKMEEEGKSAQGNTEQPPVSNAPQIPPPAPPAARPGVAPRLASPPRKAPMPSNIRRRGMPPMRLATGGQKR